MRSDDEIVGGRGVRVSELRPATPMCRICRRGVRAIHGRSTGDCQLRPATPVCRICRRGVRAYGEWSVW